jgi:hypothetical protein
MTQAQQKRWGERSWVSELWILVKESKPLHLALIAYLLLSIAQAWHQQRSTPATQEDILDFPRQQVALHVRYPVKLTQDGDRQRGLITLRLSPAPLPAASTTPTPTLTMAITATNALTGAGIVSPSILATATVSSSPLPATLSPNPATLILTSTLTGTVPVTASSVTTSGVYTFFLSASPELIFVNREGVAYSPVVTFSLTDNSQETSVFVQHARLWAGAGEGKITATHALDAQLGVIGLPIALEDRPQLGLRKFFEMVLSPSGGALVILIGLALEQLRKDMERRAEEEKEWKATAERGEQLQYAIQNATNNEIVAKIEDWSSHVTRIVTQQRTISNLQQNIRQTSTKIILAFVEHSKEQLHGLGAKNDEQLTLGKRLQLLRELEAESDAMQRLDDLDLVLAYLYRNVQPEKQFLEKYSFIDSYLAGYYINCCWSGSSDQNVLCQLLDKMVANNAENPAFFRELVYGIFRSEPSPPPKVSSLRQELAYFYVTGESLNKNASNPYINRIWWNLLHWTIDQIAGETRNMSENSHLYEWCVSLQSEKIQYEDLQQRQQYGQTIIRPVWPLVKVSKETVRDANYDFSVPVNYVPDGAESPIGLPGTSTHNRLFSEDEICENLTEKKHQVITGKKGAGKTWLRLYFERHLWQIGDNSLPVFYYLPSSALYRQDDKALLNCLARCVANQLFAYLLDKSQPYFLDQDGTRISRNSLTPFFQEYGYHVPMGDECLAQPIPLKEKLDIDVAYGTSFLSATYSQIQQAISNAASAEERRLAPSPAQTPKDVQNAIQTARFDDVFVLIDNLDEVPHQPRSSLLMRLLTPEMANLLKHHRIFLKIFVPEIPSELNRATTSSQAFLRQGILYFEAMDNIRRIPGAQHRLTIYSLL